MNPNVPIKSFMKPQRKQKNYPICYLCGKTVRFSAKCDNCGNVVCHRHRPAFVTPWYCQKCKDMWKQWQENNSLNDVEDSTVAKIAEIENLYLSKRVVEAELMVAEIIDSFNKGYLNQSD